MARTKQITTPLSTGHTPSTRGDYLRYARDHARISRKELGRRICAHPGSVAKWEKDERTPTKRAVEAISAATHAAPELAHALQRFDDRAETRTPAHISHEDRAYLSNQIGPAAFVNTYNDVLAVNDAWRGLLPVFSPSSESPQQSVNILERLLLDDATCIIGHRSDMAHRMVYGLRLSRPFLDQEQVSRLHSVCSQSPGFARLWHSDPDLHLFDRNTISVWSPLAARFDTYRTWTAETNSGLRAITLYLSRAETAAAQDEAAATGQRPRANTGRPPRPPLASRLHLPISA